MTSSNKTQGGPPDIEAETAALWERADIYARDVLAEAWPQQLPHAMRLGVTLRRLQGYYPTRDRLFDMAYGFGLGLSPRQLQEILWFSLMVKHAPDAVEEHIERHAAAESFWELCSLIKGDMGAGENVVRLFPAERLSA